MSTFPYGFDAEKLRAARTAAGASVARIAREVGVTERAVSLYLAGSRVPRPELLPRLARAVGEAVEFVGPGPKQTGVGVGADGVGTAGSAVVLAGRVRSGVRFAQGVVALERADQQGVGVVEQDDAVAGEVVAGLVDEGARDDAAFEAGYVGGRGEGALGGGAGDALAGGK
ncbi:helix-turn-helix transcriptional regulator [Kitasatospora sp. NPDC056184]|uniref:helix-turn-helix transcriptional regulator n=1 Tax=Kitasatospora sp. NPDC056184 TaxID=3345738 RepID=UPI0035D86D06